MLLNRNFRFFLLATCLVISSCAQHQLTGNASGMASEDIKTNASESFKNGDYTKASGLYEKLAEKEPSNNDYLFYYAESLRLSGLASKAHIQYDKLIKQDKDNLAAIEGKGLVYLQDADFINALEQFNIVITKDVSRWRTINAIGVIHSINGRDEEAISYYNMAMELSKDNPSIINNIALSIALGGKHEKGAALLRKAISSLSDSDARKKRLENNLALIYGISGKMDEAEAILRKNLPEPAVYNNLGFYAKIASDKKLAWSYLSKAISSSPVYYEKAENNIKELEIAGSSGDAAKTVLTEDTHPSSSQTEPQKARRGTHKLPLPSFRP